MQESRESPTAFSLFRPFLPYVELSFPGNYALCAFPLFFFAPFSFLRLSLLRLFPFAPFPSLRFFPGNYVESQPSLPKNTILRPLLLKEVFFLDRIPFKEKIKVFFSSFLYPGAPPFCWRHCEETPHRGAYFWETRRITPQPKGRIY